MDNRTLGSAAEQRARLYLEGQGYTIIQCNYRVRQGEIDMVAREGEYLVFIEVKYRSGNGAGWAVEALDARKCRKISRTALYYIKEHAVPVSQPVRFDVVAMDGQHITLLRDAFTFCQ